MKVENQYQSPVATNNIVWMADPASGNVAYIDAQTFAVQTISAGNAPTYLAAVPDPTDNVAIVQNVLSHDATLLRVHSGQIITTTYPSTADHANSWAVSSTGHWAIAWANAQFITDASPTQGFQDVEVIDLTGHATPISLTVGYRPSQVVFSGDETHAYAVTQDGLSVLDLTGAVPAATALYPLTAPPSSNVDGSLGPPDSGTAGEGGSPDGSDAQVEGAASDDAAPAGDDAGASGGAAAPDVSFTPDGAYAFVRLEGNPAITVVAIQDGTSTAVVLPSPPTDLTLSPTGDFALAVMRDISTVAVLPVSSPASFTTVSIPGQIFGRAIVTHDGHSALLFTTVEPVSSLTVLSFGSVGTTPTHRTVTLHAPVLAVFPTPDGNNAIVLHQMTAASGAAVEGAFSIVPVSTSLPAKIVGVPAPPTAVAIAPTSDYALVSIRDDNAKRFGLYLGLMPSLDVVSYTLASPPRAVGIAAGAARGYAAQDYPEGRITFVDLNGKSGCDAATCNASRTISGFELGARVVNGGAQ
jgi:hypothetical protein